MPELVEPRERCLEIERGLVDAEHRPELARQRRLERLATRSRGGAERRQLLTERLGVDLSELGVDELDELRRAQVGPCPSELLEVVEVADGLSSEGGAHLLGSCLVRVEGVAERPGVGTDEGVVEKLPQGHPPRRPELRAERGLHRDGLLPKAGLVGQVPLSMGAAFGVLSVGEGELDANHYGDLSQGAPNLIQRDDVVASRSRRRMRHDQIDVLGHPLESEVDLAQSRPALEERLITERLPQRPQESREVEVLLDDVGLEAFPVRCFPAEVRQEPSFGKRWQSESCGHRSFSTTRHRAFTGPWRAAPGTIEVSDRVASVRRRRPASFGGSTPLRSNSTPSL